MIWTYKGTMSRGAFLFVAFLHFLVNVAVEDYLLPSMGIGSSSVSILGITLPGKVFTILVCGFATLFSLHFSIVRRLHGAGKSGWLAWGLVVPLVNLYVLYCLLFVSHDSLAYTGSDSLYFDRRRTSL